MADNYRNYVILPSISNYWTYLPVLCLNNVHGIRDSFYFEVVFLLEMNHFYGYVSLIAYIIIWYEKSHINCYNLCLIAEEQEHSHDLSEACILTAMFSFKFQYGLILTTNYTNSCDALFCLLLILYDCFYQRLIWSVFIYVVWY